MQKIIEWKDTKVKSLMPLTRPLTRLEIWEYYYHFAKCYFEENGNLNLKRNDTVLDEYGAIVRLGDWIRVQRSRKSAGSLSDEQIRKLEKIGMLWKTEMSKQEKRKLCFLYAQEYYMLHGNLFIPCNYVVSLPNLGVDLQIGQWVRRQREYYHIGSLSEEQIKALEAIGMVWDYRDAIWMLKYNQIKDYYEKNRNLNFPKDFTFKEDELQFNPDNFLIKQKSDFKKGLLSDEKVNLLESIGLNLRRKDGDWYQKYNCLLRYYQENGHINVPNDYKDDYILDESFSLKAWILEQRKKHSEGKLSQEQILLLDKIGMIWNIRSNTKEKVLLMNYYHLNRCKNPSVIKNISSLELNAKIQYCLDTGRLLLNPDNTLNEIFTMSSKDMSLNLDVSLEDLIIKYEKSLCLVRK